MNAESVSSPHRPSEPAALPGRSAALRATHALVVEVAGLQPAGADQARVQLRISEALKGTVTNREIALVVPTRPPLPAPLERPVSPWQSGTLRAGLRLLALAETRETALERVLAHPALRSLWPGEAADEVRALLAAEARGPDAHAALQLAVAHRDRAGPLLGEWLLQHLVEPLSSRRPLVDDVRALLAARDTSPALREALARALYEAALLSWESDGAQALTLARALLEGALRPEVPEALQRRLVSGEVRALLADTSPPPSPDALLPDPAARARVRSALAAVQAPATGALGAWMA